MTKVNVSIYTSAGDTLTEKGVEQLNDALDLLTDEAKPRALAWAKALLELTCAFHRLIKAEAEFPDDEAGELESLTLTYADGTTEVKRVDKLGEYVCGE